MKKPQKSSKREEQPSGQVGGREFGNVIDPMQAQMASENRGLADDSGASPTPPPRQNQARKSKKKAA